MTSGGNSLTAAVLLIIMMKVFSVLTLSCPSEMYQAEDLCCPKCPAGNRVKTDCTKTANTSCVACEGGTHMDKPSGLKQCTHCSICDPSSDLKKKRACTTTSDTICEPWDGFYCVRYAGVHCEMTHEHKCCNPGEYFSQAGFGLKENRTCTSTLDTVCEPQDGFYCVDLAAGSCVAAHKHRQCQPGEYIKQTGTAFRDTECSDCSNGTFSDGTLKFCWPHRVCESLNLKLITPGNATTDAQCEEQGHHNVVPIILGCLLPILVFGIVIVLYVKRKRAKYKRAPRQPAQD